MTLPDSSQAARWRSEAAFFDEQAERNSGSVRPIDPLVFDRYAAANERTARFPLEYAFARLGDIKGKRVLDLGCGEGGNTVLLALLGAHVTGVDISPGAIRLAQRQVDANGVSDRVNFICSPFESAVLEADRYDIVWCEAILHHLLAVFPSVLETLSSLHGSGAMLILIEPCNLSNSLRRLRFALPIPRNGTPDERPLEDTEISQLQTAIPSLEWRHFGFLSRTGPLILGSHNYENASPLRRGLLHSLAGFDSILFRSKLLRKLSSVFVASTR